MSENMKAYMGEFLGCAFASCFGLGFLVPFCILGYLTNMYEFAVWFGLVFAFDIMIFAPISGAHFNPGVTLTLAIFSGFDKKMVLPYIVAQVLGWIIGLAPIAIAFSGQISDWVAAGNNAATIWYCGNGLNGDIIGGGLVEFLMSAFLMLTIYAVGDDRLPHKPSAALFPIAIGASIAILVALGGGFTGTCLNFGRDLGPRIFGFIYGLITGQDVSAIFAGWTWIMYIVFPTLGCIFGGFFYQKCVGKCFPAPAGE